MEHIFLVFEFFSKRIHARVIVARQLASNLDTKEKKKTSLRQRRSPSVCVAKCSNDQTELEQTFC